MPPLRDRGDDILLLARRFLVRFAAEEGKRFGVFAGDVEDRLVAYDWPGNVRQLQNTVHSIVVLHDGETVETAMLPPELRVIPDSGAALPEAFDPLPEAPAERDPLRAIQPLRQVERRAIEEAIRLCEGNIPLAAALLGVSHTTIYRKQQRWRTGAP